MEGVGGGGEEGVVGAGGAVEDEGAAGEVGVDWWRGGFGLGDGGRIMGSQSENWCRVP